jgi:hypothetical protein
LFSVDLGAEVVELGVFGSQLISGLFKSLFHATVDFLPTFLVSLYLEVVQTLDHLGSNLLGGFKTILEFLFELTFFSLQKSSESLFTNFKVRLLSLAHVSHLATNQLVLDQLVRLGFPVSSVGQILLSC